MEDDYTKEVERPRLTKKLPSKFTKQEAMKLLEVVYNYPYQSNFVRARNYAIFSTFIFTGIRRQELLNLMFTDVDLDNMTLFIRQGKGSKDRIVPISYQLADTLKKYITERQRLRRTCPEFFVSVAGNFGFTRSGLKHVTEKMKKASGLKFGLHKLRHTFATLMLEGGCDIYALSKMMGHSDIKTTTIYLMARTDHLKEQMFKHPLNDNYLK